MSTINHNILNEAIKATADRPNTHGKAEDNFMHTSRLWTAYLGVVVTPTDVCQMQVLAKISRAKTGDAKHADHYVDQAGYSSLAGRMAVAVPVDMDKFEREVMVRPVIGQPVVVEND